MFKIEKREYKHAGAILRMAPACLSCQDAWTGMRPDDLGSRSDVDLYPQNRPASVEASWREKDDAVRVMLLTFFVQR